MDRLAKAPPGAGSKGLDNQGAFGSLQEHDDANPPVDFTKLARDTKAVGGAVLQGTADDANIRIGQLESIRKFG